MLDKKTIILVIISGVVASSASAAYSLGATNIIFKTSSDGVSGQEVMRITSDGNVGIGTTTPQSKLDVNGGIVIGGTPQKGEWNSRIPLANVITPVDSGGFVGGFTSITIGTDGLPVISYRDYVNQDLKVAKCGNVSCSSGNTLTTVDSAGEVGFFTSIAIGTDGLPMISYYDLTNGDLKLAHCGNSSCSAGNTITTLDSVGDVGEYTSITIGTDGLPIINYQYVTGGNLKVAKCGNVSCSSGNLLTTVDYVDDVGDDSSITIGIDGLPIISYFDKTNNDLKVIKCGNSSCSAGNTITTLDYTGSVGEYTSITIGPDGLPIISYRDNTNLHLKVAHCGNSSCSAGNTITTLDSSPSVGYYTSITIGTDGLPIVSYLDDLNGNLKVTKCGSILCIPNWIRR